MRKIIAMKSGKRALVLFSVVLMLLSLFLLGTGFTKVSGARSIRRNSRTVERERWSAMLDAMSVEIPERYRSSWRKMAEERPEMMIRLATSKR